MGNYLGLPLLALAAVLQATVMPQFRVLGGEPDLGFLLVLAWAIHAPLEQGVVWAFVGGILQDLLSLAPTGASVVGMVLIVFLIDLVRGQFYRVGLLLIAAFVIAGTIIHQLAFMGIIAVTGYTVHIFDNLFFVTAPTLIYNLILIWPVYLIVRMMQRGAQYRHRSAP
ncbi:MAG: rod shape-determining protein MreD [Chloroflexi bacterium]|nr:rod shape-determining protein MreD [Chloroflexota bacterium]